MTTATPNSIHAPTHENTQPEKKGKGGYKKYDGLTRHKLRKRVLDLYRAGTTNSFEMAEILTKEGLGKQDTGRVEANHVARAIRHWRQMGELPESTPRTRPPRDLPPKTGEASAWTQAQESPTPIKPRASVSPTILSILTDPDLDDTQKVGMIAAYANVKV